MNDKVIMKQKRSSKATEASSLQDEDERGTLVSEEKQARNATNLIALHRARMFDWKPTAVTALAATSDGTVLAAARESGNLELWNTDHWTLAAVCSRRPISIMDYVLETRRNQARLRSKIVPLM